MPEALDLSPDELLSTTRAVRRKLDLTRPVPTDVVRECVEVAIQAPSGSNMQPWRFIVITDPEKRRALADIYRRAFAIYRESPFAASKILTGEPEHDAVQQRVMSSAEYLTERLHEVPVLVVPCVEGWTDGMPERLSYATMLGSVIPAAWSFCLAARARGLGTSWTTLHLLFEEEAAELLGVPYETVRQVALIPVAYAKETGFRQGYRMPADEVIRLDSFG
jgi:nitroreductase